MSEGILHSTSESVQNGSTWEFWYKKNSEGYGDSIIFNKEDCIEVRDISGNLQWALMRNGESWTWTDSTYDIALSTIYYIALTYDNNYVKTYVNGNLIHSYSYPGILNHNDNQYKLNSRSADETNFSNGGNHTFYAFRIYGRALTSAEIRNIYNNEKHIYGL